MPNYDKKCAQVKKLNETMTLTEACKKVGISTGTYYRFRNASKAAPAKPVTQTDPYTVTFEWNDVTVALRGPEGSVL